MPKSPPGDIRSLHCGLFNLVAELKIELASNYHFDFQSTHRRIGDEKLFENRIEVQCLMKPLDYTVPDFFRLALFLLPSRILRFRFARCERKQNYAQQGRKNFIHKFSHLSLAISSYEWPRLFISKSFA